MPNYRNGKIYKLVSPKGLIYIGSTTQPLCERKAGHKANYVRHMTKSPKKGESSVELYLESPDMIDIVLIENYPCDSKEELHKRERFYMDSMKCVNKTRPCITDDDKKEYIKNYKNPNESKSKELRKLFREYVDSKKTKSRTKTDDG